MIIIAIDLKSFYASVECVERGLDPLRTNLVVADPSRTEKTICLAVSPALKRHGIPGRARLFEVVQRAEEVNRERLAAARRQGLTGPGEETTDAAALDADPSLRLGWITAPPRMRLYEEYSTRIYQIYLRWAAPEDIHVYSIDEVFIDVTRYLKARQLTPRQMARAMIRDVLRETGITATAGIGTNLYLAKVAMDVVAKHVPADADGVRIAVLDERSYRRQLWTHTPLTDFWRVGPGYARSLEAMGLFTMGDVARASLTAEDQLYARFGVNAELLIDHAWGWEPTTIADIKAYRPEQSSLSSGQVLASPYEFDKALLIVREMAEGLAMQLVAKGLVSRRLELTVCYDTENLQGERGRRYRGEVTVDRYGRRVPKHAHGTIHLPAWTSAARRFRLGAEELFRRIADEELLVRRMYIAACNVIPENEIPPEEPRQLDFFTDWEQEEAERARAQAEDAQEHRVQQTLLALRERFGSNAVVKGMSLQEGATAIQRNEQIGGHKA